MMPEPPAPAGRGDRNPSPIGPIQQGPLNGGQLMLDGRHTKLLEQADGLRHSHDILKRHRDQLEAPGIGAEGIAVLRQPGEVIGPLEGHPPGEDRVEFRDEATADVDEAAAPGRQQPFLPPAGQDIHRRRLNIQRQLTQGLNRVYHQELPARPRRGRESAEVNRIPRRELGIGNGQAPYSRVVQAHQHSGLVRPPLGGHGDQLQGHATVAKPLPGVDVGRELAVTDQDDVARPEGQRTGRHPQAEAGVGREGDFGRIGVEEARHRGAGVGERPKQVLVSQLEGPGALEVHPVRGAPGPLRQGADRGMIEIDRAVRPGKFLPPSAAMS